MELKSNALAFTRQLLTDDKGIRRTRDRNQVTGVSPQISPISAPATISAVASTRRRKPSNAWKPPPPCRSIKRWTLKAASSWPARIFAEQGAALCLLRRTQGRKNSGPGRRHAGSNRRQGGCDRRGPDGRGIATVFANAGLPVTMVETDAAALARGLDG